MTKTRKLLLVLAILVGFIVLVFATARWGWRIAGFAACNSSVGIDRVEIEDGDLVIGGFVVDSASSVVGTLTEFRDGTLYIGVKSNLLLGFFDRFGGFTIRYPADGVNTIVLRGGTTERVVWDSTDGLNPGK